MRSRLDSGQGRKSVRLQSKRVYNGGLFAASIAHAPIGCGVWPAFWMFGEDREHMWPAWGELDILEGFHNVNHSFATLHTGPGCSQNTMKEGTNFTSRWSRATPGGDLATDCNIRGPRQWSNEGCSQVGPKGTMGTMFNQQGGGTIVTEWDPAAEHIRIWFWANGSEPADVRNQTPTPQKWGKPLYAFSLAPDVCPQRFFRNMRLVFDITFCGDLAGSSFSRMCGLRPEIVNQTCEEFVEKHPYYFTEAYWRIRGLDVYYRRKEIRNQSHHNQDKPRQKSHTSKNAETILAGQLEHDLDVGEKKRMINEANEVEQEVVDAEEKQMQKKMDIVTSTTTSRLSTTTRPRASTTLIDPSATSKKNSLENKSQGGKRHSDWFFPRRSNVQTHMPGPPVLGPFTETLGENLQVKDTSGKISTTPWGFTVSAATLFCVLIAVFSCFAAARNCSRSIPEENSTEGRTNSYFRLEAPLRNHLAADEPPNQPIRYWRSWNSIT